LSEDKKTPIPAERFLKKMRDSTTINSAMTLSRHGSSQTTAQERQMSDTASQFSEQPLPQPQQPTTQFSEQPLPASGQTLETIAPPPSVRRRLRLWPGIVIIALQWGVVTAIGQLFPATPIQFQAMFLGPMIGTLAVLVWWLFFSRLSWPDRLIVPVAFGLFGASVMLVGHESIGMFGILLYGLPAALTAWIAWLVVSFPLTWPIRRIGLAIVFMLVWGYFTLIRLDGVWGTMTATLNWRWEPTTEERFLAERVTPTPVAPAKDAKALALQQGDWPGFRGPNRDNRLIGVKIPTDWDAHPPKLLWKHKVGPGWGSFAVIGKHLFTQEQWDQDEAVVCYDGDTGKPIWFHQDKARFTETVAGPGPRATPTFHEGKLYTMGAAGKLLCLDAASGQKIWEQDILAKSEAKVPTWGFASSPLIAHGKVMVFAGGPSKSVVAYDAATGEFAWAAGDGKLSYASVQIASIDGIEQALLATGDGLTSFQPKDGTILWDHKWLLEGGARCIQPAAVGSSDFLVGTAFGNGTRRLHIAQKDAKWEDKEVWTTRKFNPYFNDLVIHRGHLYGFNNDIFTCVNLDDGEPTWKERGYGCGQVLLLADQDLLLIVSEKGEAALVEANSEEHRELARFQAIKGKTWNHPVVAHGRLYVRNGEEMACYQLVEPKESSQQ
jgi:outer membrane protein assembly factor BamB